MAIALKDVAAEAGVDISTVSRALRGDPRVAPATRAAVAAVAERLGYRPNLAGQRLQAGRTGTIWFVCGGLRNVREREPAEIAGRVLAAAGYDLLIAVHGGDPVVQARMIARLDQGVADGAIIVPQGGDPREVALYADLCRRRAPVCFLDRWPRGLAAPVVTTDNRAAGSALAQRLLDHGAEQVLCDMPPINTVQEERLAGIRAVLGDRLVDEPGGGRMGVIANHAGALRSLMQRCSGDDLVAAVFDGWEGDPWPAQRLVVAVQDFAAMAERAAARVLAVLADAAAWSPAIETVPLAHLDERTSQVSRPG